MTSLDASPTLAAVTSQEWQRLAERRLFFGHQSVGGNLMQGVEEILAAHPAVSLRVVETADPSQMGEPGLYHARIGENGKPSSKLAAFKNIVQAGASIGTGFQIALLKFCYVDVNRDTDPVALFEDYRRAVDTIKEAHPGLVIVHVTLPLRSDFGTWFHLKTVFLGHGRSSDRRLNLLREQYNERLRATYGGREPLFDLARLESLGPDGRPATVRHAGRRVPVLAREWTDDGGHLNEHGRRRVAAAFLATLAKL